MISFKYCRWKSKINLNKIDNGFRFYSIYILVRQVDRVS